MLRKKLEELLRQKETLDARIEANKVSAENDQKNIDVAEKTQEDLIAKVLDAKKPMSVAQLDIDNGNKKLVRVTTLELYGVSHRKMMSLKI